MATNVLAKRRIDLDTKRIEIKANREISRILRKVRGRSSIDFSLKDVQEELTDLLTDLSVFSFLVGAKRSFTLRPQGIKLSIFTQSLKALGDQLGMDSQGLTSQYRTNVFRSVQGLTDETETNLRNIIIQGQQQGLHTTEITKQFNKELQGMGVRANAETLARTQTQLAYNAGRWQADQDPDIQEILWGYEYSAIEDDRVRADHLAMDGTILPKEDPFWTNNWPPNGWNCRCTVISIFEDPGKTKQPSKLPDGSSPQPDPGFNFNPGNNVSQHFVKKQPKALPKSARGPNGGLLWPKADGEPRLGLDLILTDLDDAQFLAITPEETTFMSPFRLKEYKKRLASIQQPTTKPIPIKPAETIADFNKLDLETQAKPALRDRGIQSVAIEGDIAPEALGTLVQTVDDVHERFPRVATRSKTSSVSQYTLVADESVVAGQKGVGGIYETSTGVGPRNIRTSFNKKYPKSSVKPRVGKNVWTVDESHEGFIRHEMGHHYYDGYSEAVRKEWADSRGIVSEYAKQSKAESFAESFSAWTHPNYKKGQLPKSIEGFFERRLPRAVKAKPAKVVVRKGEVLPNRVAGFNEPGKPIRISDFEEAVRKHDLESQVNSLTSLEKRELIDYSEQSAFEINNSIREGRLVSDDFQDFFDTLQGAIVKQDDFSSPILTYRGVDATNKETVQKIAKIKKAITDGELITHEAFTSVTLDPGVAADFAGNAFKSAKESAKSITGKLTKKDIKHATGWVYEIKTDTGIWLQPISSAPQELEMLLKAGQKFRPISVTLEEVAGRGKKILIRLDATTKAISPPLKKIIPKAVKVADNLPPIPRTFADVVIDDLTVVNKKLGGSTGAQLLEHPATGEKFIKKTGANVGHLLEETFTDDLYRALNVEVPESRLIGGKVKLSKFVDEDFVELGQATGKDLQRAKLLLQDDFAADALLGNWDVIGLEADNVFVVGKGKDLRVIRIDNGGALRYRARGKLKPKFTNVVEELDTLRNPSINPSAHSVFGELTDRQVAGQIEKLSTKRAAIIKAAPDELKNVLGRRLDNMEKWAKKVTAPIPDKTIVPKSTISPKGFPKSGIKRHENISDVKLDKIKALHDGDILEIEELDAVVDYVEGAFYEDLNKSLREGVDLTGTNKDIAINLQSAIKKQPLIPEEIVYRGVSTTNKEAKQQIAKIAKAIETDDVITTKQFWSTSLNPREAVNYGHSDLFSGSVGKITKKDLDSAQGYMYEIKTKKGMYISHFTEEFSDSGEIVHKIGAKFKPVGMSVETIGGQRTIVIQMIDAPVAKKAAKKITKIPKTLKKVPIKKTKPPIKKAKPPVVKIANTPTEKLTGIAQLTDQQVLKLTEDTVNRLPLDELKLYSKRLKEMGKSTHLAPLK